MGRVHVTTLMLANKRRQAELEADLLVAVEE